MSAPIRAECVPQNELSSQLIESIARLKMLHWSYDFGSQVRWLINETDSDDRHLLLLEDELLVAYLRLTRRTLHYPGHQVPVTGVSTVAVAPTRQGQGLGLKLMRSANGSILSEPGTIGALCCADDKVGFYAKCSWKLSRRTFNRTGMTETSFFQDQNVMTFGSTEGIPDVVYLSGKAY